jgi:hypothetical protein
LAFQAKYYYENNDFKTAYKIASKAYSDDTYNMMAFTIKQQSEYALKLIDVMIEAKESYVKIQELSSHVNINTADLIRIKFICLNVIDRFDMMNFPILNKSKLLQQAESYKQEFVKILQQIEKEIKN